MTDVQTLQTSRVAEKYAYACGQRPLAGFTIKHSIGKGAFGEVYFALSDGGKEVALKLIRDNLKVELRGIAQCLNLKHTNLVHLYDLRTDDRGDHWLVMEYVDGESLRTILDRYPQGVAPELAAEWFQGFAAGVQYLHDHGIVHRDLKPGNIFLEKGLIKVGDYSLCKLMDVERGMQTHSIGTVHYMAPEVSTGNYNRQVDVYAAGIVLYELLCGRAPFEGHTAGEIIMKHLSSLPNLANIPSAFVPVLDQALRKNPSSRFPSIADMAKKVAQTQQPQAKSYQLATDGQGADAKAQEVTQVVIGQDKADKSSSRKPWMEVGGELVYAGLLALLGSLAWSTVFTSSDWQALVRVFVPTMVCSWIVMLLGRYWTKTLAESGTRRLMQLGLGALVGLLVVWMDGYGLQQSLQHFEVAESSQDRIFGSFYRNNQWLPVALCYTAYYGLMFGVLRWWRLTERNRAEMFSLQAVVATILWAFLLLFLLPTAVERQPNFAALVLTSGIVQLASPWEKAVVVRKKRYRLPGA